MNSVPYITLAMPAYNEGENIVWVVESSKFALERTQRSWEILVIDNNSSDDTAAKVGRLSDADPRIRLIVHDENRYYSGSCNTALHHSRGQYVAIMDSDGQFSAEDVPLLLDHLRAGANIVFGWRKVRYDPLSRKIISWAFNRLARWRLGVKVKDLNVGLRMFDREFIRHARIDHRINMANPELYVHAVRAGLRIDEAPIQHAERDGGESCHNLFQLLRIVRDVNAYFSSLRKTLGDSRADASTRRAA